MNAPMKKTAEETAQPVVTPIAAPQPAQPAPQAAAPVAEAAPAKPKKKRGRTLLLLSVPVLLAAGGGYFYFTGGRFIDTDNAYVQQVKVSLSADVSGRVTEVDVAENQVVKPGDLLFRIDPTPYQIALDQAEAGLAAARVNVEQLRVAYGTAQAKLDAANVTLGLRQKEFDRKKLSVAQGNSATSALDDVTLALQTATSGVALAKQELAAASAALAGNPNIATDDVPAVKTAMALRDKAQRDLDKTTVVAPAAGVVSQMSNLNVGQFVSVGTTMASLIKSADFWIDANFKETQLDGLKNGLPVEVAVDAYPGLKLEGKVDSIGAATGSQFSLIPAQNATGNWVKVTQRLTVRVKLDDPSAAADVLRSGMSATVAVDTGKTTYEKMFGAKS